MPKQKKDLVHQLYLRLRDARIPVDILVQTRGYIKEIQIGAVHFMTKYANNSGGDDHHFFGFTIDDIEKPQHYAEAILVIGNENLERCYSVPYSRLTSYIKTGRPVYIPRQHSESYKATIYPTQNYVMKVAHGDGSGFRVESFRVIDIENYFSSFVAK
jgi:hypothetical protein